MKTLFTRISLLFALAPISLATDIRPNILFCISDDQSYAHTGANGDRIVQTPAF
ncbi:MAG TPA: heparan N-sulfatase, partial [Planctomycetaceae bacterium]|nr:heparan N-sulfatase [Planctomycetaceae bacterium]